MKVTHYGQDYCYVTIGNDDYECSIIIGKGIDALKDTIHRRNIQIKDLKSKVESLENSIVKQISRGNWSIA